MKAGLLLFLAPLATFAAPTVEARQASVSIDTLMKAKGKLYFGTCSDQGRLTTGKNAAIIQPTLARSRPRTA
jgi:endo-1,4-beta-xylanase